jgi:glycosyltransferase involved in cell wall biosynthesis
MQRLRIGIVTTWFERGAAYVSRQYRDVLRQIHEVFIYARGGEQRATGDPRWDGPEVTWGRPGLTPFHNAVDLDDFARWIEQQRLDIVFFNEQAWWAPVVLCAKRKVCTGAYVDYYTPESAPLFDAYDFLVCNTRRHHSVFRHHPQSLYVPWGTDLDVFRPRGFGLVQPETLTFFHSAGMSPPRKGTDLVVRAFDRLQGPVRLVIHTQHPLESCFPELTPVLERRTRDGTLEIRQQTVTAPGLYHLGDVYVYPSRLDGIGLTVAEAFACGLPVITVDHPPMNEFVNRADGLLTPVAELRTRSDGYYWPMAIADETALAAVMQRCVERLAEVPALKEAARRHAETHLDWRKNAQDLGQQFAAMRRLETPAKAAAVKAAEKFEARRAAQSARAWVAYHCPGLYRAARGLKRRLRP